MVPKVSARILVRESVIIGDGVWNWDLGVNIFMSQELMKLYIGLIIPNFMNRCRGETIMQSVSVLLVPAHNPRNWTFRSHLSRARCQCKQYTAAMGGIRMHGASRQSAPRLNLWSITLGWMMTLHVGPLLTRLRSRLSTRPAWPNVTIMMSYASFIS